MKVQVEKWGSSLAIRIPKSFAVEISIEQETFVAVSVVDAVLFIPMTDKKHTLNELLDGVIRLNIHGEVDAGPSVGKELL